MSSSVARTPDSPRLRAALWRRCDPARVLVAVAAAACGACQLDTSGVGLTDDSDSIADAASDSDGTDSNNDSTSSPTDDDSDAGEDTTDSEDSGSEDGGPEPSPYYGDCTPNDDSSCEPGEFCYFDEEDAGPDDDWVVCTLSCGSPGNCLAAPGNLPVVCLAINQMPQKHCFISCANDQCPNGMVCDQENASLDRICVWK